MALHWCSCSASSWVSAEVCDHSFLVLGYTILVFIQAYYLPSVLWRSWVADSRVSSLWKDLFKTPLGISLWLINVGGVLPEILVCMKHFGLTGEGAQILMTEGWIKEQLPRKWPLKWCVYMYLTKPPRPNRPLSMICYNDWLLMIVTAIAREETACFVYQWALLWE